MTRRVVITGMGGVTAFGEDWPTISRRLHEYENAVRTMTEWQAYDGLQTLLAAP
ncbi:beta-ketoacyl-ACP synthase, partial [Enterobacter hormaechei]